MASPQNWVPCHAPAASRYLSSLFLNTVHHDLGVLFGVNFTPPMAFSGIQYQTGGDPDVEQQFARWRLPHAYDTFNYRIAVKVENAGDAASMRLTIAPSESGATASNLVSACSGSTDFEVFSGSVDLSGYGFAVGDRYVVRGYVKRIVGSNDNFQVSGRADYFFESAGSTGWVTPPTFSGIVTASNMEDWCDDLRWLKDRIALVNHSFGFFAAQTGDTQPARKRLWHGYIKHTGSLLNYRFRQRIITDPNVSPLGVEEVRLYYNGSLATCSTCDGSNNWKTVTGSFNLAGKGLTPGNFYEIYLDARNTVGYSGQVEIRMEYAYETQIISPSSWNSPCSFESGCILSCSFFNTTSSALQALHDERRDMVWPVRDNYKKGGAVEPSENSYEGVSILHRAPWLHYLGSGQIVYGEDSTTLPEADTDNPGWTWTSINLDEVAWLPIGAVYRVEGSDLIAAFESYDS